jgi:enediyne biosynthesis protein E4
MSSMKPGDWTRRHMLRTLGTALVPAFIPTGLRGVLPPAKATPPFSRFVDVAAKAGLTQTMFYGENTHNTYIIEVNGAGCAFFDYDNDGSMDIFMLSGRRLEGVPPGSSNRLYHNNRDGTFTDVTAKAGLLDVAGWACGVCVGDYNNDGFEDLFLTYYGQNRLYRNNGDGTFTDVTAKAGLLYPHTRFGSGCTFVDYNRDGLLDLFVSNYVEIDLANAPRPSLDVPNCNYDGVPTNCGPNGLVAPSHFLYRNNGDGTFTDVSKESGIASLRGYGFTAVGFDADEDGWQDIFVACDSTPSYLLLNNHDGTFREEALLRGVALSSDGHVLAGMGVGVGDYDLDGHLDILKTHFQNQATGLYHNNGKGEFEDVTASAGLASERRFISWGTGLVDFDNDGHPDILVVTGTVYPELEKLNPAKFPARSPRIVFRNQGNGTFVEMGTEVGATIFEHHGSRGCAFGDFDNDGDLDVLIMNRNEPPSLLRNDAPAGNRWIKIRLEGVQSNRSAIGSRVLVRYGGKVQAQCVVSQASFLSSNDPRLHFGLGTASTADVEVYWPTGKMDSYARVAVDQLITIREGQGIVKGRPFR